jgi:hypothetical protein
LFQPGNQASVGKGRPVGSKNKLKKAAEIFEALGISPLEEAAKELNKITDPEVRFKCFVELASYAHAKPRDKQEIEMTGLDQLVIIRSEKPKIIDVTPSVKEIANEPEASS